MSEPSRLYEESGRMKITAQPKRLEAVSKHALADPEKFWAEAAKGLRWERHWDKALVWEPPFAKWFSGGMINASVNCLDRHIDSEIRNKAAIIWEGEDGQSRTLKRGWIKRGRNSGNVWALSPFKPKHYQYTPILTKLYILPLITIIR